MTENHDKNHTDILKNHSLHYLEMALRTDKLEIIEKPDGYGKRTGECGDTIEMFITVRDDHIQSVKYYTNGCLNTNACANAVILMTEGKPVDDAWEITPEKITDYLETLPLEETHCAELAVGALYLALRNFQENQKAPWKKLYHRRENN